MPSFYLFFCLSSLLTPLLLGLIFSRVPCPLSSPSHCHTRNDRSGTTQRGSQSLCIPLQPPHGAPASLTVMGDCRSHLSDPKGFHGSVIPGSQHKKDVHLLELCPEEDHEDDTRAETTLLMRTGGESWK